jgi:DNA-binding MarR family transcriptional regulator
MICDREAHENALMDNYEFWGEFAKVHRLISKEREIELARYGITPEQSHVLHYLHNQGGSSTISEIAASSLVNHNAASMIVRRMEKLGYLTRSKTKDSKHFCVTITDKGEQIFQQMPVNSIEMTFSSLSTEEKRYLLKILNKLEGRSRELLGLDYKPPFLA